LATSIRPLPPHAEQIRAGAADARRCLFAGPIMVLGGGSRVDLLLSDCSITSALRTCAERTPLGCRGSSLVLLPLFARGIVARQRSATDQDPPIDACP
jgi:hypothetical protein